ncbi:hypothetical protein MBLNU457_g0720t1 [Dothideomycetes sp. NU457]
MLTQSISHTDRRPSSRDSLFPGQAQATKWGLQGLRRRRQSHIERPVTPAEAVWFLTLPEKIRKSQFSKEEQILIRAKSELALLNASPELRNIADDAMSIKSTRRKSYRHDSPSRKSSIPCVPSLPEKYRRDTDDSDYNLSSSSTTPDLSFSVKNSNGHRDSMLSPELVLASNPPTFLRSPTIGSVQWDQEPTTRSTLSLKQRTASTTRSMMKTTQRAQPPPPIQITSVTYTKPLYLKDPNTKAMLRETLATPAKFEETLAFGFKRDPSRPRTPGVELYSPGCEIKEQWLDADKSEGDSIDPDLSSADDTEGPMTPDLIEPRIVRPESAFYSLKSSVSAAPPPTVNRANSNTAFFEELMNRDMTLRMTLTKPELRASDEEIYGRDDSSIPSDVSVHEDPLAPVALQYSDDVSGAYGAFAQSMTRKKSVKAFWFKK